MAAAKGLARGVITWAGALVLAIVAFLLADGNKLAWGVPPTFEVVVIGLLVLAVIPVFCVSAIIGRRAVLADYLLLLFFLWLSCGAVLAISSERETSILSYAPHALAIGAYFIGRVVNFRFYALFLSRTVLVLAVWMAANIFLWRIDFEVRINEKSENLFHVEFIMAYAAIVYLHYSRSPVWLRRGAVAGLLLACAATREVTTYLGVFLMSLFWPQILLGRFGRSLLARRHRKTILVLGSLLAAVLFVLCAMLPLSRLGHDLGFEMDKEANVGSRLMAYRIAVDRFLESPWVGGLYSQSRMADLGFDIIPTHNDWLDFLAGGGVVGFVIIASAWLAVFIQVNNHRVASPRANTHKSFNAVFALWVMFSMSMLFNSPCSTPRIIFFWGISMGLLVNFLQSETARSGLPPDEPHHS